VPGLPHRAPTSVIARPSFRPRLGFRPVRVFLQRGLLEQSVAERLVWAAIASCLLWLAIWWALS
jgi:hypothetical protein